MKRLGFLVVVIPLLVSGLAPAESAEAGPTCQGRPATIVGGGADHLVGTEGDDVIVTGGVGSVEALGGDDLICAADTELFLEIHAGPGDDVVDTTAATDRVFTDLGPGEDRFVGGPQGDTVSDSEGQAGDSGRDVIETGAGNDSVDTGNDGLPNHDLIDLGSGRGSVHFHGTAGGTARLSSQGAGFLSFRFGGPVDTLHVDNRNGQADLDGAPLVSWHGFASFSTEFSDVERLVLRGGDGPESLTLSYDHPTELDVRTGGGSDTVTSFAPVTGSVDGGGGRDLLISYGPNPTATGLLGADITADLGAGLVRVDRLEGESWSLGVTAIEDLSTTQFRHAALRGDRGPNLLDVRGSCRTTLVGRAGADRLQSLGISCNDGALPASTMRGDQGPDRLIGSAADDLLIGGPGRDVANGRGGTDTCRTEIRRSCERR